MCVVFLFLSERDLFFLDLLVFSCLLRYDKQRCLLLLLFVFCLFLSVFFFCLVCFFFCKGHQPSKEVTLLAGPTLDASSAPERYLIFDEPDTVCDFMHWTEPFNQSPLFPVI